MRLFAKATVTLPRSISFTVIASPPDMAGLPGMAQVLSCIQLGCFALLKKKAETQI